MKAIERTGVDYYCQVSDVEFLQELVRSLPDNPVCVNIGAAMGTSTLAMLEAREDSIVLSIDAQDCPLELEALKQSGIDYKDRYDFTCGRSQEVGMDFCPRSADLVFVDGGHTYQDCYEDGRIWYEALKNGGVLAFHDYEADMLAEVKPAVDAIALKFNMQKIDQRGKLIAFRKMRP